MNMEENFKQKFCYEISECGRFFDHYSEEGFARFLIIAVKTLVSGYTTWQGVVHQNVIEYVIANGEDKFARVWMFNSGKVNAPGQYVDHAVACENMEADGVVSVYAPSEYRAFCIDASDNDELKAGSAPASAIRSFKAGDGQFAAAMKLLASPTQTEEE